MFTIVKKYSFLILLFIFISCGSDKKSAQKTQEKPETSQAFKHSKSVALTTLSKKEMREWKEYSSLNNFLERFKNISPNEALSNALELKSLVKNLKDSIRPKELKIPEFKARVNVLENESLRLADMTYISAITPKEVNNQVAKFLLIYSSTNSKINSVYRRIMFERNIDIKSSDFIGLDSTKIDSTSRKKIQIESENEIRNSVFKQKLQKQ